MFTGDGQDGVSLTGLPRTWGLDSWTVTLRPAPSPPPSGQGPRPPAPLPQPQAPNPPPLDPGAWAPSLLTLRSWTQSHTARRAEPPPHCAAKPMEVSGGSSHSPKQAPAGLLTHHCVEPDQELENLQLDPFPYWQVGRGRHREERVTLPPWASPCPQALRLHLPLQEAYPDRGLLSKCPGPWPDTHVCVALPGRLLAGGLPNRGLSEPPAPGCWGQDSWSRSQEPAPPATALQASGCEAEGFPGPRSLGPTPGVPLVRKSCLEPLAFSPGG